VEFHKRPEIPVEEMSNQMDSHPNTLHVLLATRNGQHIIVPLEADESLGLLEERHTARFHGWYSQLEDARIEKYRLEREIARQHQLPFL
jgi:hypothetical protein